MPVYAQNWMIPDLIRLWRQCFDDPEEYVAFFMAHRFRPEHALVSLQGGKPVGVAYFLPCRVGLAQARYGYAVGVAPALRGQGIGGAILSCAEEKCDARGELLLVAPRAGLSAFYHQRGYEDAFFCRWWQLDDAGPVGRLEVGPANAADYVTLRERAFPQAGLVRWDERDVVYALAEKRFCGGLADCLRWQGSQYLLFGHRENRCLVLEETTLPAALLEQLAPSLCAHYQVKQIHCRLPADARGQPSGCCYGEITWDEGWLGLELT